MWFCAFVCYFNVQTYSFLSKRRSLEWFDSSQIQKLRRPHLIPGLGEGRGVVQVVPADAAPGSPVVCDGLTRSDIFIIQYVAVVIQDATACQLAAAPARPRPHHLTVQRHHCGGAEARWTTPTGRRTRLRGEAAVHLPAVSGSCDQSVVVRSFWLGHRDSGYRDIRVLTLLVRVAPFWFFDQFICPQWFILVLHYFPLRVGDDYVLLAFPLGSRILHGPKHHGLFAQIPVVVEEPARGGFISFSRFCHREQVKPAWQSFLWE